MLNQRGCNGRVRGEGCGPADMPDHLGLTKFASPAHELYHIVTGTTDHRETGVAKAAFSTRDLVDAQFEFDNSSISRMRPSPVARVSDSDTSDSAGR